MWVGIGWMEGDREWGMWGLGWFEIWIVIERGREGSFASVFDSSYNISEVGGGGGAGMTENRCRQAGPALTPVLQNISEKL